MMCRGLVKLYHYAGLIILLYLIPFTLDAQAPSQSSSAYIQGAFIKVLQIEPGIQSLNLPFWVDQTTSFSLTASSLAKNLSLRLVDPNGTVFVHGAPNSDQFQNLINPNPQQFPDAPGAHYYMNLENPTAGQWMLQISVPSASTSTIPVNLNFSFKNQVGPVLSGGGGSRPLGTPLAFSVAVMDGSAKVNNLQIDALLYRLDDITVGPVPIAFADDGLGADYAAGDAIYSNLLTPSRPGAYMLQVEVSGDASTGHFQRSISSGFKITRKTASITGNITVKPRVGVPK